MLLPVKIGQWDNLGKARALLQTQVGQLGANELASHVTVNPDNGRLRILVATDACLIDYSYSPMGADPQGAWILRGQATRWPSVRGLRLVTDAQVGESGEGSRAVWRFVSEEPKMELTASSDDGDTAIEAMLAFARACFQSTT